MVITTFPQLVQALEQIGRLNDALIAFAQTEAMNPQVFAMMAEGPMDGIRALYADVEQFVNTLSNEE